MTDNLKGAALMTLAMAGFAIEDMFIKWTATSLGPGMVIFVIGAFGALVFGTAARRQGVNLLGPALWTRPVMARNASEVLATICFVTALTVSPLSLATAILQATPLVVTMGAALMFGAQVGWRRWSAILAGLFGVLLILRPGFDFEPTTLWAVGGMAFLAIRDLATRATPRDVPTTALATWALAALTPTGLAMIWFTGGFPSLTTFDSLALSGALVLGLAAYYAIIEAMRIGDIPVVTPFRYTRLLFALTIAVTVFGERPDPLTLLGAAIILAAGLYTLWREARVRS